MVRPPPRCCSAVPLCPQSPPTPATLFETSTPFSSPTPGRLCFLPHPHTPLFSRHLFILAPVPSTSPEVGFPAHCCFSLLCSLFIDVHILPESPPHSSLPSQQSHGEKVNVNPKSTPCSISAASRVAQHLVLIKLSLLHSSVPHRQALWGQGPEPSTGLGTSPVFGK